MIDKKRAYILSSASVPNADADAEYKRVLRYMHATLAAPDGLMAQVDSGAMSIRVPPLNNLPTPSHN
jgi:hypothetical protein